MEELALKKYSKWTALLLAVVIALSGCAPSVQNSTPASAATPASNAAASKTEVPIIRYGFTGGEVEEQAYQAGLAGAEEKFGVKIEWVRYPDVQTLWNNLPAQIAAGTAPDLVSLTNENYLEFVNNGMFLDMAPYVTAEEFDFERVTDAHKCWKLDGKIYAIPTDGAPAAFIVNMDMWNAAGLGELPKTMEEVHTAAKALTKGDVKGLCVNDIEFHLTQYVLTFGGGWGEGKTINTPENAAGLQFVIDLYREGLIVTPKSVGLGWDGEVFGKGLAAMSTGGVWYAASMQEMAPDMNYKIIPIPKGVPNGSCTSHSDATAVISSTKYPEIASKICAYMGRDEAQNAIADLYGNPPAYKDLQQAFFDKNEEIAALIPAIAYAEPFGYPVETKRFVDLLTKEMDEALYIDGSTKTAAEVLANVEKELNA